MQQQAALRVDWCSAAAAKYAVTHWHYSRVVPVGKLVRVGAWEDGEFIGCVLFGMGANNRSHQPFGLQRLQVCELVRVALKQHRSSVTKIMAIAMKFLQRSCPGIRLVISYADPEQGHIGTIYQAANWLYLGMTAKTVHCIVNGKRMHKRTASGRYGTLHGIPKTEPLRKHKYVLPFDSDIRARVMQFIQPYPKRAVARADSVNDACAHEGA